MSFRSNLLLFEDITHAPRRFNWLDCSKQLPRPSKSHATIKTKQDRIFDTCIVEHGGRILLLAADPFTLRAECLAAYNVTTGEQEWRVSGRIGKMKKDIWPKRVCTDGAGNIFVSTDSNNQIVMLSAKGIYERTILNMSELGGGRLEWMRWDKKSKCLVIVHRNVGLCVTFYDLDLYS